MINIERNTQRDRANEFCGCGGQKRYLDCHRQRDRALSDLALNRSRDEVHSAYFMELMRQERPSTPPEWAWRW